MTYTQDLANTYAAAHKRLMGPVPRTKKYVAPPPPPLFKASPVEVTVAAPQIYPIKFRTILDTICERELIAPSVIRSGRRPQRIAQLRQLFYYLATKYSNQPSTRIGRWMSRDHSTVLHGVKMVEKRRLESLDWEKSLNAYNAVFEKMRIVGMKSRNLCPYCGK